MKKVISIMLILIAAFSFAKFGGEMPIAQAASLTQNEFDSKLSSARSKYPNGCNNDTYSWYVAGSLVGYQCHGYARWLSYYVWGSDFRNGNGTNWTRYEATSSDSKIDKLVPGDVIRYRGGTSKSWNHTIFVTSISGDTVYFTDCNSDGNCTVKWDRSFSKSTLSTYLKTTLYNSGNEASSTGRGYIAHYTLNNLGKHTHSYSSNYESAHPHKVYAKCSCGDWYYTGDTKYLDSCSDCWDKNRVDVWASRVNETTELSEGIVKNRYQFWFKFANKDTGALYNSYGSIRGYKSKISVYNPDGSELYSYTYDDSDYNWIRAIPEKIGKYKIEIVLTGNITAKYSEYFEVKSDAQITFDTGHLIMVKGQSKSFYAKATGNWPKNSYLKESIDTNIATAKRDGHTITITAVKPGITFYSLKIIDPEGNVLTEKRIMIKVSPDVYKVTYYANGGSGAPMEQEKKYGVNLTLSSTVPLRNGYVFTGWNTKEDGSGKKYSPGDIYSENEKLNLYAQWKTNAYTLTYDGNGYSSYSSKVENVVTTTIKTNMLNRFGYTFLGWSTNSSATSASYTPGSTISLSSNTTLYAVWKSAQPVSTGNSNTVNIAFAEQAWYYKFTPSSSGEYTFESTGSIDSKVTIYKADGTEIGSDDDSGESSNFKKTLSLTSGTTYYIKAFAYSSKTGTYSFKVTKNTPASYTVSFNANGGSVSPTSVIVTAGNSATLPTPAKKYTLSYNANNGSGAPSSQSVSVSCKGWSTSNTASSASYSCGSSYKPTTNITLYAVWYSNGSATISSTKPTRSGYTFLGWSTSSSASSASYSSGSSISISSNTTLYAVWKKNSTTSYTVNYNANGGSVSPSSATVTAGNSVTLPTPTKNVTLTYNANGGSGAPSSQNVSLSCSGWSTSSTASSASYSCGSSYKPTANTTLYAVWGKGTTTLSSTKPTRAGYTFLGWANDKNATSAEFQSGTKVSLKDNVTIYAIWKADTSTPVPDDVLTVRTKSLRLDLEEVVDGRSTITMKRTNLGNCKLVASCSTPEALNLEFTESIYEDSVTLNVETNGVKGEFIVYVRLYNSSKTVLYQEEQIKVVVKDTPYDTIYLNYKDTYSVNNGSDYATYESEDSSIASVDSNGKIKANNTGSTIIYAMDEVDANLRMYKVEVDYNFFQWLILIFLFGWIWY